MKIDNLKKYLIIRSEFVISNKTSRVYKIRFMNSEQGQEVKIVEIYPGQSYPLKEIDKRLYFQIAFLQHKVDIEGVLTHKSEWSKSHSIKTIIKSVPLDHTIYLFHGDSYSILIRQESEIEKTFNINIKTPIILYNCLPCSLHLQTPRAKENDRESHNESNLIEKSQQIVPRGQKIELFNYNLQEAIKFSMTINLANDFTSPDDTSTRETFEWRDFELTVDIQNTREKVLILKDVKCPTNTLELVIRSEKSQDTGLKVSIYARNVILNNTNQKLQFVYDKTRKVAGQSEDQFISILPVSNVSFLLCDYRLSQKPKIQAYLCDSTTGLKNFTQ